MSDVQYHVLLNASSGSVARSGATAAQLQEQFAARGAGVSIDAEQARPFAERLRTAAKSAAPILVAAGGDGTATGLAEVAVATGKTLAVLPLGTANLLARDLAIPLTPEAWFEALDGMVRRHIDTGDVNGRLFLHKVVIGAVPGIAAAREQLRGRTDLAAKLSFLAHCARRLSRIRRFAAEITTGDGGPRIERVQSVAVANNDYAEGLGQVFARQRLDRGTLSLYLLRHLSLVDATRLAVEMAMGRWRSDTVLEIENVHAVHIRTRRRRIRAMVDGEVTMLAGPLHFRSRPLALEVLAPPVLEPDAAGDTVVSEPS